MIITYVYGFHPLFVHKLEINTKKKNNEQHQKGLQLFLFKTTGLPIPVQVLMTSIVALTLMKILFLLIVFPFYVSI